MDLIPLSTNNNIQDTKSLFTKNFHLRSVAVPVVLFKQLMLEMKVTVNVSQMEQPVCDSCYFGNSRFRNIMSYGVTPRVKNFPDTMQALKDNNGSLNYIYVYT